MTTNNVVHVRERSKKSLFNLVWHRNFFANCTVQLLSCQLLTRHFNSSAHSTQAQKVVRLTALGHLHTDILCETPSQMILHDILKMTFVKCIIIL